MSKTLKYALIAVFGAAVFPAVWAEGDESVDGSVPEISADSSMETPSMPLGDDMMGTMEDSSVDNSADNDMDMGDMPTSESFPDTPQNHWAYEAVSSLKKHGVLHGYPDGLYRGGRTATRYEMAMAIFNSWGKMKAMFDGLSSQIKELNDKINGGGDSRADIDDLRSKLDALQKDHDALKAAHGEDIANLKKLAEEFKAELEKLGLSVEQLKKDLTCMEGRVRELEARRHTVEISGDANVLILAGHGADGTSNQCCTFGITNNGRVTGVGRADFTSDGNPYRVGLERDTSVLHELAITLTGTDKCGAHFKGTFVLGNAFGGHNLATGESGGSNGLGTLSTSLIGQPFNESKEDLYFDELVGGWETKGCDWSFMADVGRLKYSINPYIFQRTDFNELYYKNPRWSDGMHRFDGAKASVGFRGAQLDLFIGRANNGSHHGTSIQGIPVNPIPMLDPTADASPAAPAKVASDPAGNCMNVDSLGGARLHIPVAEYGEMNLAWLFLNSNVRMAPLNAAEPEKRYNVIQVYGGDITFNFWKNMYLHGGFAQTPFQDEEFHTIFNKQNDAWWAQLGFDTGVFGIEAGYRQVEMLFAAPGSWGRIGFNYSPRDIKGPFASAYWNLTPAFKVSGQGQFYNGVVNNNDEHFSWIARLDYQANEKIGLYGSYENAQFHHVGNDKLNQWWATVGGSYKIKKNATWHAGYQFGESDDPSSHFATRSNSTCGGSQLQSAEYGGGLVFTHFIYQF